MVLFVEQPSLEMLEARQAPVLVQEGVLPGVERTRQRVAVERKQLVAWLQLQLGQLEEGRPVVVLPLLLGPLLDE